MLIVPLTFHIAYSFVKISSPCQQLNRCRLYFFDQKLVFIKQSTTAAFDRRECYGYATY